jgi:hypothetical protein
MKKVKEIKVVICITTNPRTIQYGKGFRIDKRNTSSEKIKRVCNLLMRSAYVCIEEKFLKRLER